MPFVPPKLRPGSSVRVIAPSRSPAFAVARGLVIGRFQKATGMTRELLTQIVASKPGLAGLPVIANVDFGHTTPILTFPVGGTVELHAVSSAPRLTITSH